MKLAGQKSRILFRTVKYIIRLFYPKTELVGADTLDGEPTVIVGNHAQIHGPICSEFFFPDNCYAWCEGQMMTLGEVPAYAYRDFWSYKPKLLRPFFKLLSYIIAPVSVLLFNNARTVAVYHDTRFVGTVKESMKRLSEGCHIIIFPEHDIEYSNILYDFHDKFIDLARFYYKKTGKALTFTPMYVAPVLRKVYLGKPIGFDPSADMEQERARIKEYLMNEITEIAASLPEHTVVPYRNISKRHYEKNTPVRKKVERNEKAGS